MTIDSTRGRRGRLDQEAVLQAAEALVDRDGYDALTMTSLAAEPRGARLLALQPRREPGGPPRAGPGPRDADARRARPRGRHGPRRHRRPACAEPGACAGSPAPTRSATRP
ncbi:hypothetical protein G5V59_05610 [Nocardioides sp. W3-2-3]|uniref:hypothetical protein n=1 Tax=Nocardioides convexus TaxID=2712224 RepID=UPI00241849B4|nr:hypothetical protein [Nocardioides convexus]NGZ99911.1 hypothetical protein [Nocardioides convexus]